MPFNNELHSSEHHIEQKLYEINEVLNVLIDQVDHNAKILSRNNYILEQLARKAGIQTQASFDEFFRGAKNE